MSIETIIKLQSRLGDDYIISAEVDLNSEDVEEINYVQVRGRFITKLNKRNQDRLGELVFENIDWYQETKDYYEIKSRRIR